MTTEPAPEPVGIVGLGLIGGSLGLDLMAAGVPVKGLVHRAATAERARQRGLAAEVSTDPAVLAGCGVVVLALPLDRLLEPEPALVQALPPGAVVTDVGSVKEPVLAGWERWLDGRFVAGHPMAGTAAAGVEAGQAGLFAGRPWVATPSERTDPAALAAVRRLAELAGARWLTCGAAEHDRAVALISHLPVLVGAALLRTADRGAGGGEVARLVRALASSGFADTTRVGGGNPELGTLMARGNRAAVRAALAGYRQELSALEALVEEEDWEGLRRSLAEGARLRPQFLGAGPGAAGHGARRRPVEPQDALRGDGSSRPESSLPPACPTPYLEMRSVEAWLGPRPVFRDLSLSLQAGEHTVILGPNGAGKSALIKLLSREIHPVVKPGSWLRIFGSERVNLWDLRRRIGLVSQDLQAGYRPWVPAADVVLSGFFGSVGIGRSQAASAAQRRRVAELMERLDLADLAARPFGQLSDGQRRRLLLARALVHHPQVLVLDEPTNGLDLRARHQLLAILRQLAREGTTLLLATHRLEAIVPEIRRCVLLRRGEVAGDGPVEELLRDEPLSALFDTPLRVCCADGWRQVLPG